jgi:hypothetical protein
MSHLQMLMESLNSTDGGNETTANPADEGGDHAVANETDTGRTGESENSSIPSEHSEEHAAVTGSSETSEEERPQEHSGNSEAQNATGEQESAQTQAAANCGDPMTSTASFSCWLNKYKDPDDVEDFIKQHQDLSTDTWYEKAKQSTFSMSDWLEKHVSCAPACLCLCTGCLCL